MTKKAPRRTAERILEVTLALFNRFGEPNVSTTLISSELGISPGNLYYHYPAKEELINSLLDRYEHSLNDLLGSAGDVHDVENAWFFLHSLFELIWDYQFLYRDLNDLLSKNHHLETHIKHLLERKTAAVRQLLEGLRSAGDLQMPASEAEPTATAMVVLLTYWLSFEYVRNPRQAMEPAHAQAALLRGAQHTLGLLAPYLAATPRAHLTTLTGAYATA